MAYGYVERVTRLHEVEQAVERTSEQKQAHEPPLEIAPCLREIGRGGGAGRAAWTSRGRARCSRRSSPAALMIWRWAP